MRPLVDAGWLAARLDDSAVRLLEVNDDPLLYRGGHLPGAMEVRWESDLQATASRDIVPAAAFARLLERLGIARQTTVVLYGDRQNGWAAYAYWVLRYHGHPDIRLLDGGRDAWTRGGRPLTTAPPAIRPAVYATPEPRPEIRALAPAVLAAVRRGDATLIDARPPAFYAGATHPSITYPSTAVHRGGHIPGAVNVPWPELYDDQGCLKPPAALRQCFVGAGADLTRPIITYCIVGIGSSVAYFALHELLGHPDVRNYDGAWMEWGSSIGYPVAVD